MMGEKGKLPGIVVANFHKRFTGVSATIAALLPVQRRGRDIALVDSGGLNLPGTIRFRDVVLQGWSRPNHGNVRIWHARRDVEMLAGLFLKYVLFQRWKLVFTSAAPKRHGALLRFIINRMDTIIATSDRSAAFLDWYSIVNNHGVDTDDFTPPPDKRACVAETVLPGTFTIGSFGRIRASKGSDIYVEALCALLPKYPAFSAFITGLSKESEQDFRQKLERQIADAGLSDRIIFLGDLSDQDIRLWYQRCLICVAASRREGFGLTPLEAMASGAVAVTSGAGFWPELIKPGVNGALFETGSRDALIEALEPFLQNPEETLKLGRIALDYVVCTHSITAEADAINAVYERLMVGDIPKVLTLK